jgi:hypothetical protein
MHRGNTHHLKMLDNHLVDVLIAVSRCAFPRVGGKEKDVHKKTSLDSLILSQRRGGSGVVVDG